MKLENSYEANHFKSLLIDLNEKIMKQYFKLRCKIQYNKDSEKQKIKFNIDDTQFFFPDIVNKHEQEKLTKKIENDQISSKSQPKTHLSTLSNEGSQELDENKAKMEEYFQNYDIHSPQLKKIIFQKFNEKNHLKTKISASNEFKQKRS